MTTGASQQHRPPRVLIAKVGLDGHEAGAKLIAMLLRDAGSDVIYLGTKTTVSGVVNTAIQEDVDVVGISLLSGIHMSVARELIEQLRASEVEIPVIFGGVIPPSDIPKLRDLGIADVFIPGSSTKQMITRIRDLAVQTQVSPHLSEEDRGDSPSDQDA